MHQIKLAKNKERKKGDRRFPFLKECFLSNQKLIMFTKDIMYWTKQHDELLNRFQLRPSTGQLWRWINLKIKSDTSTELEIDLKQFNTWIAKHRGKGYDPKTLKEAFNQLLEQTDGLFIELKKVTWFYFKIIVRPLSFVAEKNCGESGKHPKTKDPKARFSGESPDLKLQQQQQNITQVDNLFRKINMRFTQDALNRIWRLAGKNLDQIKQAIELLLYRNSTTKIANPHGFIVESLKHGWQEGFNCYYEPNIPRFRAKEELLKFVRNDFRS